MTPVNSATIRCVGPSRPSRADDLATQWQQLGDRVPRRGGPLTQWCGRTVLRLCGWRLTGEIPNLPQMIIAVAPHSSNFDFILTAAVIWGHRLDARYLAKRSLFFFPLGAIMRAFGGIPVDRTSATGVVEQMVDTFRNNPGMILGIAPEGTRGAVTRWRNGFAHIARQAQVPVVPTVIDYRNRVVQFHPPIMDTDMPERTLSLVQEAAATGAGRGG